MTYQQGQELEWLVNHLCYAPPTEFSPEMRQVIETARASEDLSRKFLDAVIGSFPGCAEPIRDWFPGESDAWYIHFTVWFMACKVFAQGFRYPFSAPLKDNPTSRERFNEKCAREFLRVVYTDYEGEYEAVAKARVAKGIPFQPVNPEYMRFLFEEEATVRSASAEEILMLREVIAKRDGVITGLREVITRRNAVVREAIAKRDGEIAALREEVTKRGQHVSKLLLALQSITQ